jgi:hypothetical protein
MPGLLFPAGALGFDAFETVSQDVELFLEPILRRLLPLQLLVQIGGTGFRVAKSALQKGEGLFG